MAGLAEYVIRHGDVWLREADDAAEANLAHVCGGGGELAVAHDDGLVLRRGEAGMVRRHAAGAIARTGTTMSGADGYEIVAFPVSEGSIAALNDLAAGRGGVAHLKRRLAALDTSWGKVTAGTVDEGMILDAVRSLDFHDGEDARTHDAMARIRSVGGRADVIGLESETGDVSYVGPGEFHGVGVLRVEMHGWDPSREVATEEHLPVTFDGRLLDGRAEITAVHVDLRPLVADRERDRAGHEDHEREEARKREVTTRDRLEVEAATTKALWVSREDLADPATPMARTIALLEGAVRQPGFDAAFKRTKEVHAGEAGVASLRDRFGGTPWNRRLYVDPEVAGSIVGGLGEDDARVVATGLRLNRERQAEHETRRAAGEAEKAGKGRARDDHALAR